LDSWGGGSNLLASGEIPVTRPSCKYTAQIPAGWNSIPMDTIQTKLKQHQIKFDIGLYPASQEHYFDGNYVLTGFMPTTQALSSLTFDQIVTDVTTLNKQSEITSDTLNVRFDKIIPGNRNDCLHSYFFIRKDTVILENCQSLYPTKFGYVVVLSYRKANGIPLDEMREQLGNLIQIHPDYQYTEPEKRGITLRHLFVSLAIGALVYVLISVLTKKRSAS
jgi:hypothetical protein